MNKITIGIMDDHLLFRQGLSELITKNPKFNIVLITGSYDELMHELNRNSMQVLLLDLNLNGISGLKLIKQIKKKYPAVKILVISQYSDNQTIKIVIENGANGFLSKDTHFNEITEAIQIVHLKDYYFSAQVSKIIAENLSKDKTETNHLNTPLSNREKEILNLICQEKTNRQIAEILFISPRTVDTHLENIFKKTGAKKRGGLVLFAMKNNLYKIE